MDQDYKPSAGEHPITPPPELVEEWRDLPLSEEERLLAAYRDGADQELDACAKWVWANFGQLPTHNLHQFRRPKLLSLKEQALKLIDSNSPYLDDAAMSIIRRALEALDD